jgi:hypothetical protein
MSTHGVNRDINFYEEEFGGGGGRKAENKEENLKSPLC